ncbi:MAG TPA: hypothetical protein DF383_12165, partial [Deltaproteobacteria bacterium]|nr:hypothetical protein [Deltaproteobacteria bacterium]
MKTPLLRFLLLLLLILSCFAHRAEAFPNLERPDNPALKPLNFGFVISANQIVVSPDDRYIVVNDDDNMEFIDTSFWGLAAVQAPALSATTRGFDFQVNSNSLFIYQSDGKITRLLSDDLGADPLVVDLSNTIGTGTGPLIVSREIGDDFLFILNQDSNTIFKYNISSRSIEGDGFIIDTAQTGNAAGMAYIALPAAGNAGGETDRIMVSTDKGKVLLLDENLQTVATIDITSTNPNCSTTASAILTSVAISPQRNLGFVIAPTDNVIHVIDTINAVEVDADPTESGINPICFHQIGPGNIDRDINSSLKDLVIVQVNDPLNATLGYVTGNSGVTVFSAVFPFEFQDIDSTTNEIESIPMSAQTNRITASSQADGYIYTANIGATLSVISENPFVTIASADPNVVSGTSPSFTITFQADAVCDGCAYRLRANGNIKESGTLLLSTAFTAADQPNVNLTTPAIDINAFPESTFAEGENTVFVFVDDASGNTGRDSVTVTVDLPPPDVTILSTSFGNARGFVEINRLTQSDIKQYNLYVLPALNQDNPVCPGGLDFSAVAEPTLSVAQPGGGSQVKITIEGLTNGVAYCVAVEAQDNTENFSANRVVAPDPIIPEVTVGITGASGETGCSLQPKGGGTRMFGFLSMTGAVLAFACLRRRSRGLSLEKTAKIALLSLIGFAFALPHAAATEVTDEHWTAQFQGGFFLPTDPTVDRFLGKCCNGMYQFTFGRIFKSRYEVNLGVGLMVEDAFAQGIDTERVSGEKFNFTV